MKFKKIVQLSKGWSSYIWLIENEEEDKLVLKEVREKSPRKDLAEREGKMLQLANSINVGPKLSEINFEKNYVIMEHINGEKLFDFVLDKKFDTITKKELYELIKELYKQLLALDKINLSHNQLQVGKNILIQEKILNGERKFFPVIIDFEKATLKENNKTKNIGQIESFLFFNPHGVVAKKIREKLEIKL
ncbi:MAG TPA: hypothetical protein PKK60_01770 [archaeon]|nr:hypothetical protein [archaeon]